MNTKNEYCCTYSDKVRRKRGAVHVTFLGSVNFVWSDYALHLHTFLAAAWITLKYVVAQKKKFTLSNILTQLLIAFYKHHNGDELGFNSALNHRVVEDSLCSMCCLAPSGPCPISLHQIRQTESEKWRSSACANINPKFPASIPWWPWFGMTSICWLAAHISLQIVWARLICFYARLVKNVMPR